MVACGTSYHAKHIMVGEPFRSRLGANKGLVMPWQFPMPHYVCELCVVRANIGRELRSDPRDHLLLMFERMSQIDVVHGWSVSMLKKCGPKLRFLQRFQLEYEVPVLAPTDLVRPPVTPAIPLAWAEYRYSLRSRQEHGEERRIGFGTVRQLRSAAALYYTFDMAFTYPRQVIRDPMRRGMIMPCVAPNDESISTFVHTGMSRRMGTKNKPSHALSPVHIHFIDHELNAMYTCATREDIRHELACAGFTNLMAYLGWLRSLELFSLHDDHLRLTPPALGPTRNLPTNIGAVEARLFEATKSDQSVTADVVIAYTTLSGFSPGLWLERLRQHTPVHPEMLLSTSIQPIWNSRHFREQCAYPLLERQRALGEPTLQCFSNNPGNRIRDKIYSLYSWRRAGRSKVSRPPRHNEPSPAGSRKATELEVCEHGRWRRPRSSESMPHRYNQRDLSDRILITLLCM